MEETWQTGLREAFRDPRDLAALLGLELGALPPLPPAGAFPFLVPRPFAALMRPGDPRDPLLLQVWPAVSEGSVSEGELSDPVGDGPASLAPGLLRKYSGRALVVSTGSCAVHCRYCFRREFPYETSPPSAWAEQLSRLRAETSLRECVLSGGDPLTLTDSVLEGRVRDLSGIGHLSTVRVHTRVPVVLPARATQGLVHALTGTRLRAVVVLHTNHPAELSPDLFRAAAALRDGGIQILNQSVLLAGINDSAEVLEELSLRLWDAGILPYYLHALDPVVGSSRFSVPDDRGRELIGLLRGRLPGYLVPRLVREVPGADAKTVLAA
jgi:EF-P beta-lysylation protein EpmB